jgi:hypothetical protein
VHFVVSMRKPYIGFFAWGWLPPWGAAAEDDSSPAMAPGNNVNDIAPSVRVVAVLRNSRREVSLA